MQGLKIGPKIGPQVDQDSGETPHLRRFGYKAICIINYIICFGRGSLKATNSASLHVICLVKHDCS